MLTRDQLTVQCVTDENGEKRAVILPIEQYQELIEDLIDLASIAERGDEPSLSHAALMDELRRSGLLIP